MLLLDPRTVAELAHFNDFGSRIGLLRKERKQIGSLFIDGGGVKGRTSFQIEIYLERSSDPEGVLTWHVDRGARSWR